MRLTIVLTALLILRVTPLAQGGEADANAAFRFAKSLMLDREEYDLAAAKFAAFVQGHGRHADAPQALSYQALCYTYLDQHGKALAAYQALLKDYPQAPEKLRREALGYGGDAAFKEANWATAIRLYTSLIKQFPDSALTPEAWFWRAEARYRSAAALQDPARNRALQRALTEFQRHLEQYPTNKRAAASLYSAAFTAHELAAWSDAQRLLARFVKEYPQDQRVAECRLAWAEALYAQKKYDEARQQYKQLTGGPLAADATAGLAWCAYGQAHYDQAGRRFLEAARLNKGKPRAAQELLYNAACAFEQGGDADAATEAFTPLSTLKDSPYQPVALYRLGVLALQRARQIDGAAKETALATATRQLQQAAATGSLGEDGDNALFHLGEAQLAAGNAAAAAATFGQLAAEFPETELHAKALYNQGVALHGQQNWKAAAAAFDRLVRDHPKDALRLQSTRLAALCWTRLGKPEKAATAYEWLLGPAADWSTTATATAGEPVEDARQRLLPELWYRLAELRRSGADEQGATGGYREVIRLAPQSRYAASAHLRLGELAEARGDFQGAAPHFQAAAEMDAGETTAHARLRLSHILLLQGRQATAPAAANDLFQKSAALAKTLTTAEGPAALKPAAAYTRAEALYALGKYNEALRDYAVCLQAAPEGSYKPLALLGRAWCHFEQKELDASRKALTTLLKGYGASSAAPEALYLSAQVEKEAGHPAAGLQALERLLAEHPVERGAEALLLKGALLLDAQKPEAAIATYERYVAQYPKHPDLAQARDQMAWCYARLAQNSEGAAAAREQARLLLEEVAQEHPTYTGLDEVCLRRGELAYEDKEYATALTWYQKALDAAKALDKQEVNASALYRSAWCHLHRADDTETSAPRRTEERAKALDTFRRLVQTCPPGSLTPDSWFRIGELESKRGNPAAALTAYAKVEPGAGDSPLARGLSHGKALAWLAAQQPQSALQEAKRFLDQFKQGDFTPEMHWVAGQAALALGATKDAAESFRQALADEYRGEAAARAQYGLGRIALQKKDWAGAREAFLKVDLLHSHWPEWSAQALLKAAEAADKNQQPDKAHKDLLRIVEHYGKTAAAPTARERLAQQ